MSATTIDSTKAGPALDDLIAERVFGLDPMNARRGPDPGRPQFYWGYPMGHDYAPAYSTDIAAAWNVVEHFGSAYIQLTHAYGEPDGERVDGWWCEIVAPGQTSRELAETAPLAICRAALAATPTGAPR